MGTSPIFDENGVISGAFAWVTDISERKATEAKLGAVLDHTPLILWAVDLNGVYTLSEGKALADFGLKPGQLETTSYYDFNASNPQAREVMQKVFAGESFTLLTPSQPTTGTRPTERH